MISGVTGTAPNHYVDAADWTNPFAGYGDEFVHLARKKRATTEYVSYRVYASTYKAGTASGYQWRVRTATDSVTTAELTRASAGIDLLTGLDCDAAANDYFVFETFN